MVAIIAGNGLGLERTSANVLGSRGQLGSAGLGRANDGVYVNAANGNLVVTNRDELLIGRGPDAAVSRTYNSLGQFTDDNGDNWRVSAQRKVYGLAGTLNTVGSTVIRTDWDGSETVYVWDADRSAYLSREGDGAYDTITRDGAIWIGTDGNSRQIEYFDTTNGGRVMSLRDLDGNIVTYVYDGSSRLIRILMADGTNFTDLTWSGNNLTQLTTTHTDTHGTSRSLTRTRYTYDASNRLSTVTVDLSPDDNSIADGRTYVTTYTYHGASKLVASIAQSDGSLLQIGYDASNRVASFTQTVEVGVTRATTFAYGSNTTTVTDAQGNATVLYYDGAGQLTRLDEPAPVAGGNLKITDFTYDGSGNLYYTSRYDGLGNFNAGSPLNRDWYRYDQNGNVYDRYQWIDGGYVVTRSTYGARNQVLTETTYTGIDVDGHGGAEPTGGMTTRYVYDAENHLRFRVTPEGRVTEYRYDAPGNLVSEISHTYQSVGTAGVAETFSWSEQDFINWLNSIPDKSTTTRTDTTYDFRGSISTVTSWSRSIPTAMAIPIIVVRPMFTTSTAICFRSCSMTAARPKPMPMTAWAGRCASPTPRVSAHGPAISTRNRAQSSRLPMG